MVLEISLPETDALPYLVKGASVREDIVLEGQLAARSALQERQEEPVRGILAFVLPDTAASRQGDSPGGSGVGQDIAEPALDYTRAWVQSMRQQQGGRQGDEQIDNRAPSPMDVSPVADRPSLSDSPEALLNRPDVKGVLVRNAQPTQLGLELLWFLRSLTVEDVRMICWTLEQTVWTTGAPSESSPTALLDSLASGNIMKVSDITSINVSLTLDYIYVLDFIHNSTIVYGPDGRKYEIELREFCPRFLFEIGEVDLPPIDSGLEDSPVSSDTE